jgi:hypothetical protein
MVSKVFFWQAAGAADGRVWTLCKQPSPFLLARWGLDGVGLIAKPELWMTVAHARALRIYSVFSIMITLVLFLYYWGRNILDLAKHLFFTKAVPPRPDEDSLPTFTDGGAGMSAYVPQVHDGSFMFPMLATDLSTMDTHLHIPWVCDYDLMNFANDLGPAATAQGLAHAFSVVKRYGPLAALSLTASPAASGDAWAPTAVNTGPASPGMLEVVPLSRESGAPSGELAKDESFVTATGPDEAKTETTATDTEFNAAQAAVDAAKETASKEGEAGGQ